MFVITGASDGLGLELAKLLQAKGKSVVSLSRSDPKTQGVEWIKTDLQDDASIKHAADQILACGEKLEALVNCAGVMSLEKIGKITASELERVFHTNVIGHIFLTSKLTARIKKDESDVVNVASTVGTKAYADQAAYGSSKWAMRGFSLNLQLELKDTPCRVISFCAGGFQSNIAQKITGKALADPENWMSAQSVAQCLLQTLELPKNMEISEIILNRKYFGPHEAS